MEFHKLIWEVIKEVRIYNRQYGPDFRTSTEYELTPEEQFALKGMTTKQRQKFASMKLKQARRNKGLCIQCGKNPAIIKPNGKRGIYCEDCLKQFRAAREKLIKKRGSCARCPNPPLPGKKLCQKCEDELKARRLQALKQGICIKCFKKKAEKDDKGNQMQVCRDCAKLKKDKEELRRETDRFKNILKPAMRAREKYRRDMMRGAKIGYELEEQTFITKNDFKQLIKEVIDEVTGKPYHDEFSDLPISRQRKYQLRREKENKCIICGEPAVVARYCLKHAIIYREAQRRALGYKTRRFGSKTYKLQLAFDKAVDDAIQKERKKQQQQPSFNDYVIEIINEIGRPPIKDEFSDLPISNQHKWRLRMKKAKRCIDCGQPATIREYCLKHAIASRERQRRRLGNIERHGGSLTYRLKALADLAKLTKEIEIEVERKIEQKREKEALHGF